MPQNELRLPRVSAYTERISRSLTDFYEEVPPTGQATQEWQLFAVQHINAYTTCELCGHFPIRRLFWIENRTTGEQKCIGSECARNYVSVNLVEAWERRLTNDQSRRRNQERREANRQTLHARNVEFQDEAVQHSREHHGDVMEWLTNEANVTGSTFLADVRRFMLDRGYISDRQAFSVRRNMPRVVAQSEIQRLTDEYGNVTDRSSSDPARRGEVDNVPDGDYSVRPASGVPIRVKVHTVASGQLAGQRVIKRINPTTGNWEAFAFLTRGGNARVWVRFQSLRGTLLVAGTEALLLMLRQGQTTTVYEGARWYLPSHSDPSQSPARAARRGRRIVDQGVLLSEFSNEVR